jgi:hypothetical protein
MGVYVYNRGFGEGWISLIEVQPLKLQPLDRL